MRMRDKVDAKQWIGVIAFVAVFVGIIIIDYVCLTNFDKYGNLTWLIPRVILGIILCIIKQAFVIAVVLFLLSICTAQFKIVQMMIDHVKEVGLGILVILIIVNLFFVSSFEYEEYMIRGKKQNNAFYLINLIKDISAKETEVIKVNSVDTRHEVKRVRSGKGGSRKVNAYYLEFKTVDGERYIIPTLALSNRMRGVIYDAKAENELTIYKNTCIVTKVNGVDLFESNAAYNEQKKEFDKANKNRMLIEYVIKDDGKGYDYKILDDSITEASLNSYSNALEICFMNEDGEMFLQSGTKDRMKDFFPTSKPGVRYFYVYDIRKQAIISNTIKCTINDDGLALYEDAKRYNPAEL